MKKIYSICFLLLAICLTSVQGAELGADIEISRFHKEICINGYAGGAVRVSALLKQENSENHEAVAFAQTKPASDGMYNMMLKFPEGADAGRYTVVVGGLSKEVTKTLEYYPTEADFIWIEAENYKTLSGEYKVIDSAVSSGRKRLVLDTATGDTHSAEYEFSAAADTEYDIWVLATRSNVAYVSEFAAYVDGEAYRPGNEASAVYTTDDIRKADVCWIKVTSKYLSENAHTIDFVCSEKRSALNDIYLNVIDAVAIVPSDWNWTPYKFRRPYSGDKLSVNFNTAVITKQNVNREQSVNVIVSNFVTETTKGEPNIYASLMLKGETVAVASAETSVPMSQWVVGKNYVDNIKITVPFNAPDSDEYEIVCGIGKPGEVAYKNVGLNGYAGKITVGTPSVPANIEANITNISEKIANKSIELSADVELTAEDTVKSKMYIKLIKDNILWGCCISEDMIFENGSNSVDISLKLPDGIPPGTYNTEVGIFTVGETFSGGECTVASEGKYGYKPLSCGTYRSKKTGKAHFWFVNQENTLIWDGEPYIPIGGMFCSEMTAQYGSNEETNKKNWQTDMSDLKIMIENGVTDIYLNPINKVPNWVMQFILDYIDELGLRYGLQYGCDDSNKKMNVFYIGANSGRIEAEKIENSVAYASAEMNRFNEMGTAVPICGQYIAVDENENVVENGKCTAEISKDGKLDFRAELKNGNSAKVYFTPFFEKIAYMIMNYWDNGSEVKSSMKNFSENISLGDGFRMFVDPVANESGFYNQLECIRPYGENYNALFAEFLKEKYGTEEKLKTAWKCGDIDFAAASGIIPLYTAPENNAGVYYIYCVDPETQRLYKLDGRNGVMWDDFLTFRDASFADFINSAADMLKTDTDVPVVLKNVWGYKDYFINRRTSGGIDGLGSEAYGDVYNDVAATYGMCAQFKKTAWLIATETGMSEDVGKKYESGEYGYGTEKNQTDNFEKMRKAGVKGIYDFVFSARHNGPIQTVYSYIENPEQFKWLKNYSDSLDRSLTAKYIPRINKMFILGEGDYNLIPSRRTAVLYNDSFESVMQSETVEPMESYGGRWGFISKDMEMDCDVFAANFENAPTSLYWGERFTEMCINSPENKKNVYLGFRKDLGAVEYIDKYFTGSYSYNDEGNKVQILTPTESSEVLARDRNGNTWALRDGNLWIIACDDWGNRMWFTGKSTEIADGFGIFDAATDFYAENKNISYNDGNYKLSADIYNYSKQPKNIFAVLCDKHNEKLNGLRVKKCVLNPGKNSISVEFASENKSGQVEGFVWTEEMKPILEKQTY